MSPNKIVSRADFEKRIKDTATNPPPDDPNIPSEDETYWDSTQAELGQRQFRQGNCQFQETTMVQHDGIQERKVWTGWEIFVRQVNAKKFCVVFTRKGALLRWQLQKHFRYLKKRCPKEEGGWTEWEPVGVAENIDPAWILLVPPPSIRDKSTEEVKGCYRDIDTANAQAAGLAVRFGVLVGEIEVESEEP